MEQQRHAVFISRMEIRWGDMDAMGHVNNTVYFRYMEQARVEWLDALGYPIGADKVEAAVIVSASCTFLVPLTYPGAVEVRVFVGQPGRSSLPTYYEIRSVVDETLCAEGTAKIVWISPATGKSVPLPEALLRQIASQSRRSE